jgi:enamine deaminase RidA (YjgF/YER057c/UK114 family)
VNCSADFVQQPQVINGASDLLVKVLGEKGQHARSAVGVNVLPFNASVEVEAIFEVIRHGRETGIGRAGRIGAVAPA